MTAQEDVPDLLGALHRSLLERIPAKQTISDTSPAGYPSRVRNKMTDEQRAELTRLAEAERRAGEAHQEALRARNLYMTRLHLDGIGATEIGRCVPSPEDPDETMHRITVDRIVKRADNQAGVQ